MKISARAQSIQESPIRKLSALANAASGKEIWVAAGTYLPTTGTERSATFQLKSGVALYGGYAGFGAADPNARDTVLYETAGRFTLLHLHGRVYRHGARHE